MKIAKLLVESHEGDKSADDDATVILWGSAEALVELVRAARDAYDNGYDRQKMERALAALGAEWEEE